MRIIACAHPGKIGDALFALPTVRELCRIHQAKADFFVQPWCEPARDLIEYQPYINKMITTAEAVPVEGRLQPLTLIPNVYADCFDISWSKMEFFPLPESLAEAVGLSREIGRDLSLEIPRSYPIKVRPPADYVVLSVRSQGKIIFKDVFEEFAKKCPIPVFVVGGVEDRLDNGINITGIGFLAMAQMIAHARAYVGVFSAPLVVAQAFPIPKTCVFDGTTWHPHQIIMDGETQYLVKPTAEQLIESCTRKLRVQRV